MYKRQTQYTIFDTETFTVEAKSLEYDRTNFEQDLLKENYPEHFATELLNLSVHRKAAHQWQVAVGLCTAFLHVE